MKYRNFCIAAMLAVIFAAPAGRAQVTTPTGTMTLGAAAKFVRGCQHDVGHAIGAVAYAAALMGWRVRAVPEVGDWALSALLGIASQEGPEAEHPDLLLALWPGVPGEWEPAALLSASHHRVTIRRLEGEIRGQSVFADGRNDGPERV